jgi:hypothetical protein
MGSDHAGYRETLYVPVSYWLLAVPVVALLGAEIFVGFSSLVACLVYAAFVIVVGGFLLAWGATRVEVRDGALRAGGGTLPLGAISEVMPLDAEQARVLGGPRADPAARLLLRPYLKKAVYIGLSGAGPSAARPSSAGPPSTGLPGTALDGTLHADTALAGTPQADTLQAGTVLTGTVLTGAGAEVPYWLVATRRPDKLAAALTGGHATMG